ncbi:MAG: KpsF/GutQ family sugar-phosphate isomerase [Bacteroidales bacterium]|jgi:arabinose-5-phosphate isomerase|nr:KpsF/GutQ family sugar-phosphate isomerase [Bacteroidales bacterium]
MNAKNITETAIKTINTEANAIKKLADYVDEDFSEIVEKIYNSNGRLVITGIGKSANIANKMVATLNSTGTPSLFMHAADAIHGDLGIIQKDDIVLCISKSGNTPEIKVLVPLIKKFGNLLIGMVSNTESFLAQRSDYVIKAKVDKEACPNNLAPTSSTTAQLVMGDALAVSLLEVRGFSSSDFARVHPGGALGKKLYVKVDDLLVRNEKPEVNINSDINSVILEISSKRLGATAVTDDDNKLVGMITDGDLRRMLAKNLDIKDTKAKDIMSVNPKTVEPETMAAKAFNIMEDNNITQLIVTRDNNYLGMVHIHDIISEGVV